MWVIYSSQPGSEAPQGVRINKSETADETRFWLRPGRSYTAARAVEGFDFYLTHKKHSRKDSSFTLTASECDPKNSYVATPKANSDAPSHDLEIVNNQEKKTMDLLRGGDETEIQAGQKIKLRNGDAIRTQHGTDSMIYVEWLPVHLYFRVLKRKELEATAAKCAKLGITFSFGQGTTLPDASHTHFIVPKLQREATVPQLVAAGHHLSMVNPTWAEELFRVAHKPDDVKRSKLEEDFTKNWPDEMAYFPPVDGKDNNHVEKEIWKPTSGRRKLFEGCVFVDFSGDPNEKALVTSGGGLYCTVSLTSHQAFTADLDAFKRTSRVNAGQPVYIVTQLGGIFETAAEAEIINAMVQSGRAKAVLDNRDMMYAVTKVEKLAKTGGQAVTANGAVPPAAGTAPILTGTGAQGTADIVAPPTQDDDVAVSAPKRPAAEAAPAEAARPSKKPRRLGDRGPVDVFATMFEDAAPAAATQVVNARGETQGSLAGEGSMGSSSSMPPSGQGRSQQPVRADSKYAKVRRKAGTSSLALGLDESVKSDKEDDAPPAKKFKSFDPDVESATSQVQERFRKQQQLREAESLAKVMEEEDEFAAPQPKKATQATSKKKAVQAEPESDDEPTQPASKRKGTQAAASQAVATGKKGKTADAAPAKTQPAYLQVNTGRRKIAKAEMEINDEFNKLKIKKPVAAEAHKMGWNERDVLQEEMNENVEEDWQPADKSTFFQIKYVAMVRPDKKAAEPPAANDPKYAGKPNFKAFRPKTGQAAPAKKAQRLQISLVVHEPLGYGLRESYGQDGGAESEEDIVMPMQETATKRTKSKSKASQSQKSAPSASAKGKKKKNTVVSSESEEEEEEQTRSDASVAKAPPRTARAKETITIDSDSDDADGKTFGGFNRTASTARRRR